MGLVYNQWLFLKNVAKLISYGDSIGMVMTGGELYRTKEQQEWYVSSGRSWTVAGMHMKRLAIDFNIFVNNVLTWDKGVICVLGVYWEGLDVRNRWGGNFSTIDVDHFEMYIK